MTINTQKDFRHEKNRLKETRDYLEKTLEIMEIRKGKHNEEIKDAYVHLDHTDSSLSYSNIMLHTEFLDDLEKNYELLKYSRKTPYFARIDIRQKDKDHKEELYIGKVSLYEPGMETPLVVDWRAPIASVYYDGRLGETAYKAGKYEHVVDLSLKRQYTIEDGQLSDYMDVDISTSDTFLQASLNRHAEQKLKDIVSTIQSEQNQIIRADVLKPLVVQGAAGSGKTTIALHRIAYLLYTYADIYYPEQFMILAPNTLFLDYISSVLPELGANRVQQTTYVDLMSKVIGKKIRISDTNEKLNTLIRTDENAISTEEKNLMIHSSRMKNSLEMKEALDRFAEDAEKAMLPEEDLMLEDHLLYAKEDLKVLFFENYAYLPLYKRVDSIRKYLAPTVRTKVKHILKDLKTDYDRRIDNIMMNEDPSEERRKKIGTLREEREARIEAIEKGGRTVVKKYMSLFAKKDLFAFYQDLLLELKIFAPQLSEELCDYIAVKSVEHKAAKVLELEDLAALAYLKEKLFGMDEDLDTKMVFIDEAQDFSDFQFYVLRHLLKTDRFTILGDLSQGIHMYRAIHDWSYLKSDLFDADVNYLTLEQSYRTTIEIMKEANFVLSQCPMEGLIPAKPVVRHGEKPEIIHTDDRKKWVAHLLRLLENWESAGMNTMAVIAKTSEEAKIIHKELKRTGKQDILLVDEKTQHYDQNIVVIPAHLSKGLEFDAVIIASLMEKYNPAPLDTKLMYVAMTRAMHKMAVLDLNHSIGFYKGGAHEKEMQHLQ
ncbi:RNA polymerase recycling motor HelD [Proteiniclasticum sp. C24MP]|uniref:RNA polymerase recycling motor HelD n=1 Tax=Proteiniclasticum sp. C24MP TaxID=3374101 RepID=UPI003754A3CF